jgi:hypothetical protein
MLWVIENFWDGATSMSSPAYMMPTRSENSTIRESREIKE